jgi:hypothetical protein
MMKFTSQELYAAPPNQGVTPDRGRLTGFARVNVSPAAPAGELERFGLETTMQAMQFSKG